MGQAIVKQLLKTKTGSFLVPEVIPPSSRRLKLRNGAEVSVAAAVCKMVSLRCLAKKLGHGPILLKELYLIGQGKKTVSELDKYDYFAIAEEKLIDENDEISDEVRNILKCALVEREGSKTVYLRQPYPDTEENRKIVREAIEFSAGMGR